MSEDGGGETATNASFRTHRKWAQKAKRVVDFEVEVTTLDHLVEDSCLESPVALWIDVEGFAHDVLLGSQRLLEQGSVCAILVEVESEQVWEGQGMLRDIRALLAGFGFVPGGRDVQFRSENVFNALFVRALG
jgi:hypothetical protein